MLGDDDVVEVGVTVLVLLACWSASLLVCLSVWVVDVIGT